MKTTLSHRSPLPYSADAHGQRQTSRPLKSKAPQKIALTYILVSALYIAVSDRLAAMLASSIEHFALISQVKGWGFALFTGIMLYALIRRHASAQEQIQHELRESNERLALVTSTTPAFLFEIDRDGTILLATKRFKEMTGDGTVGSTIYSLLPEQRREAIRAMVASALTTSLPQSLVYTTSGDPSQQRTFSLTLSPLQHDGREQSLVVTAYDITDIKKVEEQVRLQARLLDAVEQAVIATDVEGTIWYWNKAAQRIYGWTQREALGRNIMDVTAGTLSREEAETIMHRMHSGEHWSGEFLARRKDGTSFPAFVTNSPIHDVHGALIGFVSVSRDISEQKRTAEELERSHERFQLIARASNDAIWDWDIAGGSVWRNETFYRAYGYAQDFPPTFDGWVQRIHPEDKDRVVGSILASVEKRNLTWSEEYRFLHANGSVSYVVDRGFLLCDENGQPMRMVGSMMDITSLKLSELDQRFLAEERRKLLQRLRFQFERMPIACIVVDRNFRITEWNPACERIFGFSRDEVLGRCPFDLIIPASLKPFIQEFIERLKTGGETLTAINENITKDGRTILCEWFDTPLRDEHGDYIGMMAMAQDITERRQAEEALKKSNEQLRQLSAYLQSVREEERKRIAREIHDELGQELTALKMQAAYVQRAITKHDRPTDTQTLLELISLLIGMTDGAIKTVRRIATELRPDVLDKVGLMDALKWQAQEFEKRTGVSCQLTSRINEWNFPDDVATALFRIFQEALTNVSRHAAATRVTAELSVREGWVEFCVQDNGRGITREQIENSSSLGLLGLSERARLLGGTATIHGVPGTGTTICVLIPLPPSSV